jgi:DnaJ like chaperone protein
MSWWGKLFGGTFGFMLGGPLGALIGAAIGHGLDTRVQDLSDEQQGLFGRERIQMAFFTATFSVMGHVAKADGRVTADEIRLAQMVMQQMQLDGRLRKLAQRLFNEGKASNFPLDDVLDQLKRECRNRQTLLRMFLEIQMQAAMADGVVDAAERKLLLHVATHIGFSVAEFEQLEAMMQAAGRYQGDGVPASQAQLSSAYALLNVTEEASDADIKKAYRRLMSQHHPDKLVAKGLPEEMMKMATEKTHQIRQAYELIREQRGF